MLDTVLISFLGSITLGATGLGLLLLWRRIGLGGSFIPFLIPHRGPPSVMIAASILNTYSLRGGWKKGKTAVPALPDRLAGSFGLVFTTIGVP